MPSHNHAQPRAAVSVKLAGWLRVASVHAPPAVDFVNGHADGGSDHHLVMFNVTR